MTIRGNTLFSNLKQYGALVSSIRNPSKPSLEKELLHWEFSKIATLSIHKGIKTLRMKTVFDVLITIRGTSIIYIFVLLPKKEKTAQMIRNKEKTGLQLIDKKYLKPSCTLPYQRGGSTNLSIKTWVSR